MYEPIKQHLIDHGAPVLSLSTSSRSLPFIKSLANAAFSPIMQGEQGQAAYVPLAPHRKQRSDQPSVVALPAPSPFGLSGRVTKTAVNACLPDAVAAWVDWLVTHSGYVVQEGDCDVPVAPRHVCLLFKRFRGFEGDVTRDYVRALEARRIPHVLSGGRSFHAREEVMAVRALVDAIEWPDDALSVYAVLRGPLVGFNDDVLLEYKQRVGTLSPWRKPAEALEGELASVTEVLGLLRSLHRARNAEPIASTLGEFFRVVRMHAGIAIWPTGEQALGNVLKVLEMARAYERRAQAASFRGFAEWLRESAEQSDTAEATVIENSSEGVRIMTVHAAKGLEFPVVVLCDPTAPARTEHASRYIDPARELWAQPLCDVDPIELVEQRDLVREHDAAEVVRLTYVAATRAREMLVVPVTGHGSIAGWVEVLDAALLPAREAWRQRLPTRLSLPEFTGDSVVSWPHTMDRDSGDSIMPGEHVPRAGEHRVVVWDPNLLWLERRAQGGVTQQKLLATDEAGVGDRDSLARYEAFSRAQSELRERARAPSLQTRTVTQSKTSITSAAAPVVVIDSGAERAGRPAGPRFGTLVHALLERGELESDARTLEHMAAALARTLGAPQAEVVAAADAVRHALSHPFFERVRSARDRGDLFRETPVTLCDDDGALVEGIIDMAFRESSGGAERMVLVDYKTDVALVALEAYTAQLMSYARAMRLALGLDVECILFRV